MARGMYPIYLLETGTWPRTGMSAFKEWIAFVLERFHDYYAQSGLSDVGLFLVKSPV